ncbi:hypothetical protein [Pleionea sp. CnH1-48]|uniref:hypothetical protein n=1 Tax=Pleionea sp. CnH1-48 TaxID=2954494 RepID=UPI002096A3CC|nr:hypothetical protein [Pleionea sp. CnH1-48]MCO7226025.1 hypothetical protein [Pleionea sp. CnH1-48]
MSIDKAESLRFLHKFCPRSRAIILGWSDFSLDHIYDIINLYPDKRSLGEVDRERSDREIIIAVYGEALAIESQRVLVIPDAGHYSGEAFVCHVDSLLVRLDDLELPIIGGGNDTLLAFETSGNLLYFDHHDRCILAVEKDPINK